MALFLRRLLPAAVPALLWLWVAWNLQSEWTLNAQYNYGWAVPVLAALALYLRWQSRPAPATPLPGNARWIAGAMLLLLLLPIRLIEEANPDWRLLSWALALVAAAFSLLIFSLLGGRPWTRHFAFPILFPLVAVPWLVQVENAVMQAMGRFVATAAVEIAGWLGVAAFQRGSIIQLHNGFVGVDDACSGVKTLQAGIMVALFLGEVRRLSVTHRVLLLIGGCGWVFLCNIGRATTLVAIASHRGFEALHRAHDLVGTVVLIAGMVGLIALAWLFRSRADDHPSEHAALARAGWSGRGTAVVFAWLIAIFVFTEVWYRRQEQHLAQRPAWSVQWPIAAPGYAEQPIAEATRAILRYNAATSAVWQGEEGGGWWGFFARWAPQRTAQAMVRSHSPEICLPATGRTFKGMLPPLTIQTAVGELVFAVYEFEQEQRALYVFVCTQEDKFAPGAAGGFQFEWNSRGRILAAWNGQRNLGQRLLELALLGAGDYAQAEGAAREAVRQIVQPPTTG